jgi:protein TonB
VDVQSARPLVSGATPEYPSNALAQGQEGKVIVTVEVDAGGKVVKTTLASSSGSKDLDDAALAAAQTWTFAPNTAPGSGAAKVDVTVNFSIAGGAK